MSSLAVRVSPRPRATLWLRRPDDVELRFQLLSRLVEAERPEEASSEFDEIMKRDPRYFRAMEFMGQACYLQRADQEAAGHFRRVLDLAPTDWRLWTDFGVALRAVGDLPGALDAQQRSVGLDGTQPTSHERLARALREALALVQGEDLEARRARARIETELRRLVPGNGASTSRPGRR